MHNLDVDGVADEAFRQLRQRARRAERALETLVTLKDVTKRTDPEKYRGLKHGAWEEARAVLRERPPAER